MICLSFYFSSKSIKDTNANKDGVPFEKKAYFAALLDSLPLPVSSVWKLVCGCRLKYFLSIHYCIITLLTPPFIFQISIPTFSLRTLSFHTPPPSLPRSFSQFLSLPSHSFPPPPTHSFTTSSPSLLLFSLVYFHIPSLPALPSRPSLLPTASQMDRKGVGPSMPANQSDPPQGAASLHYGYIRMSVVVKRTVRLKLCGGWWGGTEWLPLHYLLNRWVPRQLLIQSMATARGGYRGFFNRFFFCVSSSNSELLCSWRLGIFSSRLWLNCGLCICRTPPYPFQTKQRAASRRRLRCKCVYPQISVNTTLWSLSLQRTAESLRAEAWHLFVFTDSSKILFLSPHKISVNKQEGRSTPLTSRDFSLVVRVREGWTAVVKQVINIHDDFASSYLYVDTMELGGIICLQQTQIEFRWLASSDILFFFFSCTSGWNV